MKWLMKILGKGKKSKRGFTLIELLFVVIVIAILAAAGIAMYVRSLDKARAAEGLAILSSVRTHYLVEWAENEVPPDPATTLGVESSPPTWGIDTSKNKWWIEGTGFTTRWDDYSSPDMWVTLEGILSPIDGIGLSIECQTGEIQQNYNYVTGEGPVIP